MRILIINPNSTKAMTELVASEAKSVANPDTQIVAVNPKNSPPAIQGAADGKLALPHLYELFDKMLATQNFNAVIIACFDDTGLWQLKKKSPIPVIGIGEAGYYAAMLLERRFSVVTTLPISVPVLEENILDYGISSRCARVRASNVPVLELEANPELAIKNIEAEIKAALKEDEATAIVLGCAGMADVASELEQKFNVPIIDGVKSAIGLCEALVKVKAS